MASASKISEWDKDASWQTYREEIFLWAESTPLAQEKRVAHIILNGIKPKHLATYQMLLNGFPGWLRTQDKDQTFNNPNAEAQRLVRTFDQVERFVEFMDGKMDYADPVRIGTKSIDPVRIQRNAGELFGNFVDRFDGLYLEVMKNNVFQLTDALLCLVLFFGCLFTKAQSEQIRNHYDLDTAGAGNNTLAHLMKLIKRLPHEPGW